MNQKLFRICLYNFDSVISTEMILKQQLDTYFDGLIIYFLLILIQIIQYLDGIFYQMTSIGKYYNIFLSIFYKQQLQNYSIQMFNKKEFPYYSPTSNQSRILRFPNKQQNSPQSNFKITPNPSFTTPVKQDTKKQISHQFAYQLLCCEMELQISEEVPRDLVTKLFQLYKKGIQHYNLRQDRRQQYFKRKLEALTIHPSVLKVLHNDTQKTDNFYKKRHLQRLMELNTKNTNQSVNNMLRVIQQKDKRTSEQIKKNISTQQEQIKQRIEKRKVASKAAMSIQDNNNNNNNNFFQGDQQFNQNGKLFLKDSDSKKKVAQSFGVSQFRQKEDMDDYFIQKFVDI